MNNMKDFNLDQFLRIEGEIFLDRAISLFNGSDMYNNIQWYDKHGFMGEFTGEEVHLDEPCFMVILTYNGDEALVYQIRLPETNITFEENKYIKDHSYRSVLLFLCYHGLGNVKAQAELGVSPQVIQDDWGESRDFYFEE